jgi:predicted MFS family arabinose efflux permease
MLAPELFRSRSFNAGNAAIFLTFASLFTGVFFFSQLLQIVLGHDALGAGLRLLPWTVTFLTIAPAAGALADRIGERWLLGTGLTLQAGGLLWLAGIADPALTYGHWSAPSSPPASASRWPSRAPRTPSSVMSANVTSARPPASTA